VSILIAKNKWENAPVSLNRRRLCLDVSRFITSNVFVYTTCELKTFIDWQMPSQQPKKVPIDDLQSRKSIWNSLFNTEFIPEIEDGAVEKNSGLLDKYLPDKIPVEDLIRHAKKG